MAATDLVIPRVLVDYAVHQRRRNLTPAYVERSRRLLLDIAGPTPLDELTGPDIEDYLDLLRLQPGSRACYLSMVKAFYRWAYRTGQFDSDPTVTVDRPKLGRHLPRPGVDDEIVAAIEMGDARMRCWLMLARYQGLRCMEIAQLRRQDVIDSTEPPVLFVANGKGGHQRTIPLHPMVLDALRRHGLPRRGWLFPHDNDPTRPVAAWYVSHRGNEHLAECGATCTMHQLRHSFGTDTYRRSKDIRLVQDMMGHADPSTTAGYAAFDQASAAKIVTSMTLLQPKPGGQEAG